MLYFRDFLRVFFNDCKIRLSRAMEFRFDFLTGFIFSFTSSLGTIFTQFLIYSQTHGYPGWTFDQIVLFQAVVLTNVGIRETLFGNVRPIFESELKSGHLDRILLFPVSSLGMVLSKGFRFNTIPVILAGLLGLFYSVCRLKLALQWWHWALFLFFLAGGLLFYLALTILHCTLAVRYTEVDKLREVTDRLLSFGNYPAEIFSGFFKQLYLTFFPIAMFMYFPTQALLGRLNLICAVGIGLSLGLFWLAIRVWQIQLQNYSGAGG